MFDQFRKNRDPRNNKVECRGKVPASVKKIASDFKVIGSVLIEKEFDLDGTYNVSVKPNPAKVDTDLFYIAMKKHSIDGFFIDLNDRTFTFHIYA
jgi:hypothetical protein